MVRSNKSFSFVLGFILLGLISSSLIPFSAIAQWKVDTVPGKIGPRAVGVNPATNKIYVANYWYDGTNKYWVTEIDGSTDDTTLIQVQPYPNSLAINPRTNKIYVLCEGAVGAGVAWVTVIDGTTHDTTSIQILDDPNYPANAIVVNPTTNKIYISGYGTKKVIVIDGATNDVTNIDTGSRLPVAVAVNPNTNKVFVLMEDGTAARDSLWVINGATDSYERTVPLGRGPLSIAVNPDENLIYVANYGSNNVTIVDGSDWDTTLVPVKNYPSTIAVNPTAENPNKAWAWVGYDTGDSVTAIVPSEGHPPIAINVRVGQAPHSLAIDENRDLLYVSNETDNTVSVVDFLDVRATIAVGSEPREIVANPLTGYAYVVNPPSGNISVIKGDAPVLYARMAVGTTPVDVAFNPFTKRVYVANSGSNSVSVVNPESLQIIETISTPGGPHAIDINVLTNKIYVTDVSADSLTIIDENADKTTNVGVGTNPIAVAVNSNLNKIYVANYGSHSVSVVEGSNNLTTTVPVGNHPQAVAINPVTNKVYVSNNSSNSVTVIDGITNDTTNILVGNGPRGIAVNPFTNKIYAANSLGDNVTVIDGVTNDTSSVTVGDDPRAIAIDPVRNRIYVANFGSANVTVIDGGTNQTTNVSVGTNPIDLGVNYHKNEVYVANQGSNNMTVIDGLSFKTSSFNTGGSPSAIAVSLNANIRNLLFLVTSQGDSLRIYGERYLITDHPLTSQIDSLDGNFTEDATPSLTGSSTNSRSPDNTPIMKVLYSIDNIKGTWKEATVTSGGGTASVHWRVDIGDSLLVGLHHLYVVALDSTCGTISSSGYTIVNSPFVGGISSYSFFRATPPLDANLYGACESEMLAGLSDSSYGDPFTVLNDRGVNGDAAARDGMYQLQVFPTGNFNFGPGYQVLRYSGYTPSEVPSYPGYDVPITFVPGNPVVIVFVTTLYEDGFIPKTNFVFQAVPPPPINNWLPGFIAGDCQTEFGASSDWNVDDITLSMNDQGIKGDRLKGDGKFTFRGICDTSGTYQFKVLRDSGSWQPQFTSVGYVWDAGDSANLSFTTTLDSQLVRIETDALMGRTRVLIPQLANAASVSDNSGFAGTSNIGVDIWINNSQYLKGISIPLGYNTTYLNALGVQLKEDVLMNWEYRNIQINDSQGKIYINLGDYAPPNNWMPPGGRRIATLHFSIDPAAEGQFINIDSSTVFGPLEFINIYSQPVIPEFSFGTISVNDTTNPYVPQLFLPQDKATIQDTTPTFVWGKVTLEGISPNRNASGPLKGSQVTYTLQYALDSNFTSSAVTIPGITDTTYTLPEYLSLSENTYYWHVEAVDLFGNRSGYQIHPHSFEVRIPTLVYYEDFNDCSISDWTVYASSGFFGTTTAQYVSPPCGLRMYSYGTSYAYGRTRDLNLDTTQDFSISTYFKVPNTNNHWFWVMSNNWVELVIDGGTDLRAWQASHGGVLHLATLNPNQWYHIRAEVHPATSNYEVYVDDVYKGTANYPANYLPYLRLGEFENGSANYGEAYWDDILVYGIKSFVLGDVNHDGIIDVGDVVYLINYLFKSGPPPNPLASGDVNCDGIVNVGDVVYLINYLFKGGPPPSC